jgi:hypothetical protein
MPPSAVGASVRLPLSGSRAFSFPCGRAWPQPTRLACVSAHLSSYSRVPHCSSLCVPDSPHCSPFQGHRRPGPGRCGGGAAAGARGGPKGDRVGGPRARGGAADAPQPPGTREGRGGGHRRAARGVQRTRHAPRQGPRLHALHRVVRQEGATPVEVFPGAALASPTRCTAAIHHVVWV